MIAKSFPSILVGVACAFFTTSAICDEAKKQKQIQGKVGALEAKISSIEQELAEQVAKTPESDSEVIAAKARLSALIAEQHGVEAELGAT